MGIVDKIEVVLNGSLHSDLAVLVPFGALPVKGHSTRPVFLTVIIEIVLRLKVHCFHTFKV